jgi:hypothetical protein
MTVRNWILAGKISAQRSAAGFRIDPDQLPHHAAEPSQTSADSAPSAEPANPDTALVNLELVRLVGKLQEENRVMAGRIGWLEAQVEHPRALPAASPERPSGASPDNGGVEPTQKASGGLIRRVASAFGFA